MADALRYPTDSDPRRKQTRRTRRDQALVRPIWKSYRFKLIGEHHGTIFIYDLVDDKHDQLVQCRRRRGRHHRRLRFMQPKTQEGIFHSVYPLVDESIRQ